MSLTFSVSLWKENAREVTAPPVRRQIFDVFAGLGVPEFDDAVAGAGREQRVLAIEDEGLHPVAVGGDDVGAGGLRGVPDLDGLIEVAGDEGRAIAGKGEPRLHRRDGRSTCGVSLPVSMLNSRITRSLPPEATALPSGANATERMPVLCWMALSVSLPSAIAQKRKTPESASSLVSAPAVHSVFPSGEIARPAIAWYDVLTAWRFVPASASQTMNDDSAPALTSVLPSSVNARANDGGVFGRQRVFCSCRP